MFVTMVDSLCQYYSEHCPNCIGYTNVFASRLYSRLQVTGCHYTEQFKKKVTLSHVYYEVTSEPTITRYTTIVRKTAKVCL
jgi:hypothetical protein